MSVYLFYLLNKKKRKSNELDDEYDLNIKNNNIEFFVSKK